METSWVQASLNYIWKKVSLIWPTNEATMKMTLDL